MKKEEFISSLKNKLSVLEESEIRDIIEEYEQHIDMKMQEGLSEEEAIRDFGDIGELTAGILEAYHVKADYAKGAGPSFDKIKEESVKASKAASKGIRRGAEWLAATFRKLATAVKRPFANLRKRMQETQEQEPTDSFVRRFVRRIARLFLWIGDCIRWWVLLAVYLFFQGMRMLVWLFAWGMILGNALAAFLVMIGIGGCIVLQITGYPVAGLLIGGLGSLFVFAAFTLIGICIRKGNPVHKRSFSKMVRREENIYV